MRPPSHEGPGARAPPLGRFMNFGIWRRATAPDDAWYEFRRRGALRAPGLWWEGTANGGRFAVVIWTVSQGSPHPHRAS